MTESDASVSVSSQVRIFKLRASGWDSHKHATSKSVHRRILVNAVPVWSAPTMVWGRSAAFAEAIAEEVIQFWNRVDFLYSFFEVVANTMKFHRIAIEHRIG